jgi:hypothetical protein
MHSGQNQKKVTEQYRNNWDNIFGKKKEPVEEQIRDHQEELNSSPSTTPNK